MLLVMGEFTLYTMGGVLHHLGGLKKFLFTSQLNFNKLSFLIIDPAQGLFRLSTTDRIQALSF